MAPGRHRCGVGTKAALPGAGLRNAAGGAVGVLAGPAWAGGSAGPTSELAPKPAHTLSRGWGTQVRRFPRLPAAREAQPISSARGTAWDWAVRGRGRGRSSREPRSPVPYGWGPLGRRGRSGSPHVRRSHSPTTLQDTAAPLGPHPPAELPTPPTASQAVLGPGKETKLPARAGAGSRGLGGGRVTAQT